MIDTLDLGTSQLVKINENEYLTDVFKRENFPLNAIPTNCIFNKTLPGLGATYCETVAKRNSIIIEPNVPVIMGKTEKDKKLLGVYEGVTKKAIENYMLNGKIPHKKIICTPESYMRVKNIADDNNIDLYENYFCLYDECEKITQDIDYREQISLPMNDFFLYRNKAFVSATPLELRNPEFKEQNFFILKIEPTYEYRKKINLITTNQYEATIISVLEQLKNNPCICIFMNSTNGINKLVNYLEEKGMTDYKAFSSKKSEIKFKEKNIHNSFENLNLPLAKYNFFTSRFYSAVDINTVYPPDIIILTDLFEAHYSKIDPFTNAIQIYGRFRNKHTNGQKFNTLTHISNYGTVGDVLSESEIESYINTSKEIYDHIKGKAEKATDDGEKKALNDTLNSCSYNKFLDEDKTLNYFKIDNFFNDERVRGYYQTPDKLKEAYEATNHFDVKHTNPLYIIGDKELLKYKKLPSRLEQRKYIIKILDTIHLSQKHTPQEIKAVETDFLQVDKRERLEEAQFAIDAYNKLGIQAIESVGYYRHKIEQLLNKHQKKTNEQKMFSKQVRDDISQRFKAMTKYKESDLFQGFQDVFNSHGITTKVNLATVKKYFGYNKLKSAKEKGIVQLLLFMPDEEYD